MKRERKNDVLMVLIAIMTVLIPLLVGCERRTVHGEEVTDSDSLFWAPLNLEDSVHKYEDGM